LPCALTQTPAQFVDDPQPAARGFFIRSSRVGTGSVSIPGAPFVSDPPLIGYRRSAPRLGEDNEEMYVGGLGYSARDLEKWRNDGLV
jgi:crotonobetainyl-CoA:carnitine CoA-transferase CaiB-like acyl-CoA transferase